MEPRELGNRIDGSKFLLVYLMLFATPFWFCVLPLFIFTAPMRLIWAKPENRRHWRTVSSLWLAFSIVAGCYCTFFVQSEQDGMHTQGLPLRITTPVGQNPPGLGYDSYLTGWVHGLNISMVAGFLMLPLTVGSYLETRRRVQTAR